MAATACIARAQTLRRRCREGNDSIFSIFVHCRYLCRYVMRNEINEWACGRCARADARPEDRAMTGGSIARIAYLA